MSVGRFVRIMLLAVLVPVAGTLSLGCNPMYLAEQMVSQALGMPTTVTAKALDVAEDIVEETVDLVQESTDEQQRINERRSVSKANERLVKRMNGETGFTDRSGNGGRARRSTPAQSDAAPPPTHAAGTMAPSESSQTIKRRKSRNLTHYQSNGGGGKYQSSGSSGHQSHSAWR